MLTGKKPFNAIIFIGSFLGVFTFTSCFKKKDDQLITRFELPANDGWNTFYGKNFSISYPGNFSVNTLSTVPGKELYIFQNHKLMSFEECRNAQLGLSIYTDDLNKYGTVENYEYTIREDIKAVLAFSVFHRDTSYVDKNGLCHEFVVSGTRLFYPKKMVTYYWVRDRIIYLIVFESIDAHFDYANKYAQNIIQTFTLKKDQ